MWRDTFFSGDRERMGERDYPWDASGEQNSEASAEGWAGKDPERLCLSQPAEKRASAETAGTRTATNRDSGGQPGGGEERSLSRGLEVGAGAGEEREGGRF